MRGRFGILALGTIVGLGCARWAAAQQADVNSAELILTNGKVYTMDGRSSVAEAVAVRDGKIILVGNNAAIKEVAGPQTRVIDLGGRSVVPGLIDTHAHFK